ncbi:MAG TPA: carbonate dehydratase [Pyrinomonadaceae bacterium]|nr:carbonate dehydratase [Pyrinomonadaceae bacterium]
MKDLKRLLDQNKAWAESITASDPEFFPTLAKQQTPTYLWIGCADSRVPATQLVGMMPGEMFVHRNVANVVVHTDFNCLSVMQYAVDVLKVEHIIVCGHHGCGGVKAAMDNLQFGLIDNWLRHVQDVLQEYEAVLARIDDETKRLDRLCELNVIEQVFNVCRTTIVQGAWERGQELVVHGWIYDLEDGLLRDLDVSIDNAEALQQCESRPLTSSFE